MDQVDEYGRPWPTLESLGRGNSSPANGSDFLRLLGQTWPARMGRSALEALMLPGDVYAGRVDPLSDKGIGRAADLAGLVMGGTFAGAPVKAGEAVLGAGPLRRLETVDGGPNAASDYKDAFRYVNERLGELGMNPVGASGQSSSSYFARPGFDQHQLRVADHPIGSTGRPAAAEVRMTPERENVVNRWTDDLEGEIVENEYRKVITQSQDELERMLLDALAQYDKHVGFKK